MNKLFTTALAATALLCCLASARAADDSEKAEDEKFLRDAKQSVTGEGLLEFFKKRTPSEDDRKQVAELIRQLGNEDFRIRDKASKALADMGKPVLPHLRKEADNPDLETRARLREILDKLEDEPNADWAAAAA